MKDSLSVALLPRCLKITALAAACLLFAAAQQAAAGLPAPIAALQGDVDLVATEIWPSTMTPLTCEWITATFRVTNGGTAHSPPFYCKLEVDGQQKGVSYSDTGLAGGASFDMDVPVRVTDHGAHPVTLRVDFTSAVTETNELNNIRTEPWGWTGADLVVHSLSSTSLPLVAGTHENITYAVRNDGPGGACEPFDMELRIDGITVETLAVTALGDDEVSTTSAYVNVSTPVTHAVSVNVDPGGSVGESDEGNNVYAEAWFWNGLPDLVVDDVWSTTEPLTAGQVERITCRIRNAGLVNVTAPFWITLRIAGGAAGHGSVSGLAKGATYEYSAPVTMPEPGSYPVQVEVDSTAWVDESDEGNNVLTENWRWYGIMGERARLPLLLR